MPGEENQMENGSVVTLTTNTTAATDENTATTTKHSFAVPPLHADYVITVVSGNTRCHWSIHDGYSKDYYPSVFWK